MSRIFWLLALALVAVLTIQPLRERARPQIEFVLNPIYRWEAKNRVNEIYRVLERERAQGTPIPTPRHFNAFLAQRDGADAAVDPWKEPFYLAATRRSYYVGSAGPDRLRGNEDDLVSKTSMIATGK
jgi:hypothetical protein